MPSLIQLTALSIPMQASITYMAAKEVWKQEMPSWFPFQLYNLYFSDLRESVNSLRKRMGKKKLNLSLSVMWIQNENYQPNAIKHMQNNFIVYTIETKMLI